MMVSGWQAASPGGWHPRANEPRPCELCECLPDPLDRFAEKDLSAREREAPLQSYRFVKADAADYFLRTDVDDALHEVCGVLR